MMLSDSRVHTYLHCVPRWALIVLVQSHTRVTVQTFHRNKPIIASSCRPQKSYKGMPLAPAVRAQTS